MAMTVPLYQYLLHGQNIKKSVKKCCWRFALGFILRMKDVHLLLTVQQSEFNYLVWLQRYTNLNIGDVTLLFFSPQDKTNKCGWLPLHDEACPTWVSLDMPVAHLHCHTKQASRQDINGDNFAVTRWTEDIDTSVPIFDQNIQWRTLILTYLMQYITFFHNSVYLITDWQYSSSYFYFVRIFGIKVVFVHFGGSPSDVTSTLHVFFY